MRLRSVLLVLGAAALVAVAAAIVLDTGSGEGADRSPTSCSGAIEGSSFHFSCDTRVGGNAQGLLFSLFSSRVSAVTVSQPGGIGCEGRSGRFLCRGPAVAANATIAGSLTLAQPEDEFEGEEFEGEEELPEGEGCSGPSAYGVVYGPEESSEELEEGEAPMPVPVGRFSLSSCRSSEPEGEGEGAAATLRLGRPQLRKRTGTAVLPAQVPGPGELALTGKGLLRAERAVRAAGTVRLPVRSKGAAKRRLRNTGKATVITRVRFEPPRGSATTRTKKIVLRLNRPQS